MIRRHYAKLQDHELLELASEGVQTLRAEAVELLRSEIGRRNLGQEVHRAVDARLVELTPTRQAELVDHFRLSPCPHCGESGSPLNAFEVAEARSYVVFTEYKKIIVAGCPRCIRRAATAASRRTMLFGWWGLPHGLIYTLEALDFNRRAKRAAQHTAPTAALLEYVRLHHGELHGR